jgi:hypothetical protein
MKHSSTSEMSDLVSEIAILDTAAFINRHAPSLCEILELWSGPDGIDTLLDAIAICAKKFPDRAALAAAMYKLQWALASISTGQIDDGCSSGSGAKNPQAAIAWHGARVSDLSRRLTNKKIQ